MEQFTTASSLNDLVSEVHIFNERELMCNTVGEGASFNAVNWTISLIVCTYFAIYFI